jgi:hypothetical protein
LYNAAGGLERFGAARLQTFPSAEVENGDAPLGIVWLAVFAFWLGCGTVGVYRQLDPRAIALDTETFRFFSSPNLVDDEGRKHGAASLSR